MTKLKILFLFLIASFLVKAQTLQVALPDTSADPGASLQIPIYVDDLTGLNVISYQMTVQYDNQVVEATGITTDGTISDEGGWTVLPNTNFDAQIKVGGFGISGLSGGGILLYLNFDVVGEVGTSDLTFTEMVFNSGDPASEPVNGSISINVDTVAVMIADQTEFTGNNVNFPINVEDLTGYSVNTIYFQINYDSSILEFVEYNNSDLTTGWDATAEENLPGTVVVTMFGDDLSGAGSLGDIVFNVT
ncbi:MAG: hypothetical protein K9H06_15820, partial [Melioribacteraceae bacterium]|nr:hypothetical protein [Melioribacteraceae bacterium]